jgi:DnaJ-domain-containing protein 1
MGIWDRLGNVIKSYLNDEDSRIFGNSRQNHSRDPDFDAAFDELNDYLNNDRTAGAADSGSGASKSGAGGYSSRYAKPVPEELRPDFAELGIPFGASEQECKAAYKQLLKIHHPDRHAGHEGNFKKATEKTSRINAAYDRIEKWRQTFRTAED